MSHSDYIKIFLIIASTLSMSGLVKALVVFFDVRIHKFNRRIDIATKLLENATLSSDKYVKNMAIKIVNDSLFGLNYLVNISDEQKKTISNMIDSGLTKEAIIEAVSLINKTNGKLGGSKIKKITWLVFILYSFVSILLFFFLVYLSYLYISSIVKDTDPARLLSFINLTPGQTLTVGTITFILFATYLYFILKYWLRIEILRAYDSDGNPA